VKYSIISIYITQSVSAVKLITKDKFAEVYRLRLKENEVPESSKYKLKISTRNYGKVRVVNVVLINLRKDNKRSLNLRSDSDHE